MELDEVALPGVGRRTERHGELGDHARHQCLVGVRSGRRARLGVVVVTPRQHRQTRDAEGEGGAAMNVGTGGHDADPID